MRKKSNAKPLFDMEKPKEEPKQEVKRKRGRPKKSEQVVEVTKEEKKQVVRKVKEQVKQIKKEKPWKDFNKTKPEPLVPVEFYVDTGKEKKDIFTGYIKKVGETITDEPYKLVVLRKRYGNLHYREIDGCHDLSQCPNEFPHCKRCPIAKKKNK